MLSVRSRDSAIARYVRARAATEGRPYSTCYNVHSIRHVMIQTMNTGGQKLVAMGGGTGLSTLLAGFKRLVGKTE